MLIFPLHTVPFHMIEKNKRSKSSIDQSMHKRENEKKKTKKKRGQYPIHFNSSFQSIDHDDQILSFYKCYQHVNCFFSVVSHDLDHNSSLE